MSLAAAVGTLGAPGIFVAPPEPVRQLIGVRRDVAAFLGVAPRGPAWLPGLALEPDVDVAAWLATTRRRRSVAVAVTSWDEYRFHFGGPEGPGRLPYAVSAFFAGGGTRAYVVRVVHEHADRFADAAARASGRLGALATTDGTPIELFARNEGRWGDRLHATLRFRTRPLSFALADPSTLVIDRREWVPGGSLVRVTLPADVRELRYVESSVEEPEPAGAGRRRLLALSAPLPAAPLAVEVVTGALDVVDADPLLARREVVDDVGFRADHPRWLARAVVHDSTLVWPGPAWAAGTVAVTDVGLAPVALVGVDGGSHMQGGADLSAAIVPEDFWDPTWVPGDEVAGDGVQCLVAHDDVGLVVAPDLYEPQPIAPIDEVSDPRTLCGPDFAVHVEMPEPPPVGPPVVPLAGLSLDPLEPLDLARIVANQRALVDHADARRDLTVLLDVPLGLPHRDALMWRNAFDSPFAAAYHPWIDVASTEDQRDTLVRINPSAFAAAIIAEREQRLGVQHGPANEIARDAVRVAGAVTPEQHDDLHLAGVNVFLADRDGIRLTGARTLSRRVPLRQLSVARLMTVLRLSLEREMQWAVFEPNDRTLWAEVRRVVRAFLVRLFEAGAFRGATTKEAFFVRCDETTMTRSDLDNGRLVCLVGVAPAEPIEYIVLEIAVEATGARVEVAG
jgi:hypothetical protein